METNEELDYSYKHLSKLAKNINIDLKILNISNNHFKVLNINCFNNWEILDLSFNQITNLKLVKLPTNIKELNLKNNKIKNLGNISELHSLVKLNLSNNNLQEINILGNNCLKIINLKNNFINNFNNISNICKSVEYINISYNLIDDINNILKFDGIFFENLNKINIDNNPFIEHCIKLKINYKLLINCLFLNLKNIDKENINFNNNIIDFSNYNYQEAITKWAEITFQNNFNLYSQEFFGNIYKTHLKKVKYEFSIIKSDLQNNIFSNDYNSLYKENLRKIYFIKRENKIFLKKNKYISSNNFFSHYNNINNNDLNNINANKIISFFKMIVNKKQYILYLKLNKLATQIQKIFKGFLIRKKFKIKHIIRNIPSKNSLKINSLESKIEDLWKQINLKDKEISDLKNNSIKAIINKNTQTLTNKPSININNKTVNFNFNENFQQEFKNSESKNLDLKKKTIKKNRKSEIKSIKKKSFIKNLINDNKSLSPKIKVKNRKTLNIKTYDNIDTNKNYTKSRTSNKKKISSSSIFNNNINSINNNGKSNYKRYNSKKYNDSSVKNLVILPQKIKKNI